MAVEWLKWLFDRFCYGINQWGETAAKRLYNGLLRGEFASMLAMGDSGYLNGI